MYKVKTNVLILFGLTKKYPGFYREPLLPESDWSDLSAWSDTLAPCNLTHSTKLQEKMH